MSTDFTLASIEALIDARVRAALSASPRVGVHYLPHFAGASKAAYKTPGAAGFDLVWSPTGFLRNKLAPRERRLFTTGIAVEVPAGYELQIRSRSGLTLHQGVAVANGVGTVDSDYRGELGVILHNLSQYDVEIKPGERIAQAVLLRVQQATFEEVETLTSTDRGAGGFGSTGRY